MLTSDERLIAAISWAEGQGLGLNVFVDVVSPVVGLAFARGGEGCSAVGFLPTIDHATGLPFETEQAPFVATPK